MATQEDASSQTCKERMQKKSRIPVLVRQPVSIEQSKKKQSNRVLELKNCNNLRPTKGSLSKSARSNEAAKRLERNLQPSQGKARILERNVERLNGRPTKASLSKSARSNEVIERLEHDLQVSQGKVRILEREVERLNDRPTKASLSTSAQSNEAIECLEHKLRVSQCKAGIFESRVERLNDRDKEQKASLQNFRCVELQLIQEKNETELKVKAAETIMAERALENAQLREVLNRLRENEVIQENNLRGMERRAVEAEKQLQIAELKFIKQKDEWSKEQLELEKKAAGSETKLKAAEEAVAESSLEKSVLRALLNSPLGTALETARDKEQRLKEEQQKAKATWFSRINELEQEKDEALAMVSESAKTFEELGTALETARDKEQRLKEEQQKAKATWFSRINELEQEKDKALAMVSESAKTFEELGTALETARDEEQRRKEEQQKVKATWFSRINELEQEKDDALVKVSESAKTIEQQEKKVKELEAALEEKDKEQRLKEELWNEELLRLTTECEKTKKKTGFFSWIFGSADVSS